MAEKAMIDYIILAGGLGTRLREVIEDIPKPMAPVNGKPFLEYILNNLNNKGVKRVILSVGYKSDVIYDYFGSSYKNTELVYAHEKEPLGTGGAIRNCLDYVNSDVFYLLNGDTYFDIDFDRIIELKRTTDADIVMSLKWLSDSSRYGNVMLDKDNKVIKFIEKKDNSTGLINGGVYLLDKKIFSSFNKNTKWSFENEILESKKGISIYGVEFTNYFIDIGVKEDYMKAQSDFK